MSRSVERAPVVSVAARRRYFRRSCFIVGCAVGLMLEFAVLGCGNGERSAGIIDGDRRNDSAASSQSDERHEAAVAISRSNSLSDAAAPEKQILFGDLHVHTTYSIDAFMYSLPIFSGEGAHPPADACDFARHCAGLDFFSLNDHAEGLTPDLWERSKQSIRQCNAIAGDPENPDLVAFMGFEWTQAGTTPANHYGHKNVIFPGLDDDELPARPISAVSVGGQWVPPRFLFDLGASLLDVSGYPEYGDVISFMGDLSGNEDCALDVDTRLLPGDCRESAQTPNTLFRKLNEWGFPTLVIPHGLAWGIHAPPGARLDNQLSKREHDPDMQRLLEISSGHGNSEEYRNYPDAAVDAGGESICPEPTVDFLPCCWRAGEIVRERCADPASQDCAAEVTAARQRSIALGVRSHFAVANASTEDWLDCDQCRDCFKPALNLRPGETAQYAAAISSFEAGDESSPSEDDVTRFRWGFISSTDNHAARPGTGYKQYERRIMTDARGMTSREVSERVKRFTAPEPTVATDVEGSQLGRLAGLFDTEREASFLYPGGIVATHAAGRDRQAIWDALMRKEVYGTSGPRILLWFDYLGAEGERSPMGSEIESEANPRFEVRAVGARKQQPGCSQETRSALSRERLHDLCRDECFYPGDERHAIAAIEVVRIRPQMRKGEAITSLIEDPWRRFECAPDPTGCRVTFEDPDYRASGRDAVYYVRALQEKTPAINGANFRTEFDEAGNAIRIDPCYGGYQTSEEDLCLAAVHERAWSSPIYLDRPD